MYKGQFVDGEREGQGTLRQNGLTYKGEWKDDEMNGQGKLTQSNGLVYTG